MKALRLPTRVSMVAYLFRFHYPRLPPRFRARRSAPVNVGGSVPGQGSCSTGSPSPRLFVTWTRMGPLRSSGDPSRAFAPFQDPGRAEVSSPLAGTSVLPPPSIERRPRRYLISGLTRSFSTRYHTLQACVAAHLQGLLPAGWLAFAGRASNPLDRYERFQFALTIILLSCSPDANGFRARRFAAPRNDEQDDAIGFTESMS
jgi:hypothetical protein